MQDSTTLTPEKPVIGDDVMLAIRNLSKSFGRNRVLQHIDMDVKKGSVMGLMGENGAGKSTMMKCLFGIKTRDEGPRLRLTVVCPLN